MLPNIYSELQEDDFEIEGQPSKTYRLNFAGGPSSGMLDGLEAIKQMIFLTLHCERFAYEIFSNDYGVELQDKIGQQNDPELCGDLEDAISDALMQDDRVLEVTDFTFEQTERKKLTVKFRVVTTEGDAESVLGFNTNTVEVM